MRRWVVRAGGVRGGLRTFSDEPSGAVGAVYDETDTAAAETLALAARRRVPGRDEDRVLGLRIFAAAGVGLP